ncbi:MAG TPA: tetraacyldisaccharide 4'-kinase [Terriglobia bacterium]|nr:tetraacyldisaccharide 4'-kinase [Terriglobia bacterium]
MSRAFRFLVGARDRLYASGVLQTHRLHHPVISIGNLTVGGTGKTPLVILLAERFRDEGFRPVVLSRGYKRKGSGIVVVSSGKGPTVPWDVAGDEPFLIAKRAPGVSVVVGADRYTAGRLAEEQDLGNLFILDDGFQHRRLFRNVDLVTIDPSEWMTGERLLPSGRWREPKDALRRAHAAIVQESDLPLEDFPIPAFGVRTVLDGIYKGSEPIEVQVLKNRPVTAFAGIAKPERFFNALESLGIPLAHRIRFRDHHGYTEQDIQTLPGEVRITTEKDAVRLDGLGAGNFVHLRISVNILEFDRLLELIRGRLH